MGSYDGFLSKYEPDYTVRFSEVQRDLLRFASVEFGAGKRLAELALIENLLVRSKVTLNSVAEDLRAEVEVGTMASGWG